MWLYLTSEIDGTMKILSPFLNNNGIIPMATLKIFLLRLCKDRAGKQNNSFCLLREYLLLMPKSSVGFAWCSAAKLVWG